MLGESASDATSIGASSIVAGGVASGPSTADKDRGSLEREIEVVSLYLHRYHILLPHPPTPMPPLVTPSHPRLNPHNRLPIAQIVLNLLDALGAILHLVP